MTGQTWATYGHGFATSIREARPHYGPVKLPSGRTIYRNYGRPLKNGKGLSFWEIIQRKQNELADQMIDAIHHANKKIFEV